MSRFLILEGRASYLVQRKVVPGIIKKVILIVPCLRYTIPIMWLWYLRAEEEEALFRFVFYSSLFYLPHHHSQSKRTTYCCVVYQQIIHIIGTRIVVSCDCLYVVNRRMMYSNVISSMLRVRVLNINSVRGFPFVSEVFFFRESYE